MMIMWDVNNASYDKVRGRAWEVVRNKIDTSMIDDAGCDVVEADRSSP